MSTPTPLTAFTLWWRQTARHPWEAVGSASAFGDALNLMGKDGRRSGEYHTLPQGHKPRGRIKAAQPSTEVTQP